MHRSVHNPEPSSNQTSIFACCQGHSGRQADGLRACEDPELLATDLADYLVEKGVPFRESHEVVGRLVREGDEKGVPLPELPLAAYQALHPAFQDDVFSRFSWERSVEARSGVGGTARDSVLAQLEEGRSLLDG